MAISHVGGNTFETAGTAATSVSVNLPGGVQQNDVSYVAAANINTADLNMTEASGTWTELADLYANDATRDSNLAVYRKVQGVTPDSSVTVQAGSSVNWVIAVKVLRGVSTGAPEDVASGTATGTDSALSDPPSITLPSQESWVIAVGANTRAATVTAPSGYGNLVTVNHSTLNLSVSLSDKALTAAGAENPAAYGSSASDTTDSWTAVTIGVRAQNITVAPAVITAAAAVVAPTVRLGSLNLAPALVSARAAGVDPSVIRGSLNITPANVAAVGAVVAPTVKIELKVSPAAVEARGDADVEDVFTDLGWKFGSDIPIIGTWTPQERPIYSPYT